MWAIELCTQLISGSTAIDIRTYHHHHHDIHVLVRIIWMYGVRMSVQFHWNYQCSCIRIWCDPFDWTTTMNSNHMNAFAPPTVASVIGARFPYFKCKYKTVAFASTESNTIFLRLYSLPFFSLSQYADIYKSGKSKRIKNIDTTFALCSQ